VQDEIPASRKNRLRKTHLLTLLTGRVESPREVPTLTTGLLGLALVLLERPLVDHAAQVEDVAAHGRLAGVDVADKDNVDVRLDFLVCAQHAQALRHGQHMHRRTGFNPPPTQKGRHAPSPPYRSSRASASATAWISASTASFFASSTFLASAFSSFLALAAATFSSFLTAAEGAAAAADLPATGVAGLDELGVAALLELAGVAALDEPAAEPAAEDEAAPADDLLAAPPPPPILSETVAGLASGSALGNETVLAPPPMLRETLAGLADGSTAGRTTLDRTGGS
jgi:hypothetical protein